MSSAQDDACADNAFSAQRHMCPGSYKSELLPFASSFCMCSRELSPIARVQVQDWGYDAPPLL